ncbi:MAG: hypothetical protein H6621_11065 [Halobacteriovoraceae bacterium]|nr:hypothetical protein [Halobacteriovoraceae bacterium]MCB9095598.1 hypothetical protein [Halobacteriovoraceae bacterium]
MKFLILFFVFIGLTSCYHFEYDSSLELVGKIVDISGEGQSFDLNEGAELCLRLKFNKWMREGEELRDYTTFCRAFSSDHDGNFRIFFSPKEALTSDASIGFRDNQEAQIVQAKISIKLEGSSEIEGVLTNLTQLDDLNYSAEANFYLNKSNYDPDQKIEINHAEKKYSN